MNRAGKIGQQAAYEASATYARARRRERRNAIRTYVVWVALAFACMAGELALLHHLEAPTKEGRLACYGVDGDRFLPGAECWRRAS